MKPSANEGHAARKTGRPLSFNRDAALAQAMLAFWRHGYETTSITDLTNAMGITAPSLYAAFGNKQRLFLEAVRRYAGDPAATAAAIDGAPTAFDAAHLLLRGAAIGFTGETTPPGCLLASATASGSAESASVQSAVAAIRRSVVGRLRDRITRDVVAGVLPERTDAAALAGLMMTVMQGLSVMARDGMKRGELLDIVDAGLAAWPTERRRTRR